MKKIIIVLGIIMMFVLFSQKKDNIVIPNDAIRYRIIANSDSDIDQKIKWEANKEVLPIIVDVMTNSKTKDESKENILNSIDKIDQRLNQFDIDYNVNYGYNYFPSKTYSNVSYKDGYYESLVITLGNGLGNNWWCVLFPPLCLLDATETEPDNVEYDLYVRKILNKYHN